MILTAAFITGAAIGWWRARQLHGNTLDKLQYAGSHAIALSLLALVLTLAADWLGWV